MPARRTLAAEAPRRRRVLAWATAAAWPWADAAAGADIEAPNVVAITPRLVTSGQPSATALSRLAAQGFGAVIYLAPDTVADAVRDERAILERQGLRYRNIPIDFDKPTEADFESFVAAMAAVANLKVLVHCQVNMRASSMVFLHRVLVGREGAEQAYEAVARVWSPRGVWKSLIVRLLRQNHNAFEPY